MSMKEMFEQQEYDLFCDVPRVIKINESELTVLSSPATPDGFNLKLRDAPNLKTTEYVNSFRIGITHKKHFESREKFDFILNEHEYVKSHRLDDKRNYLEHCGLRLKVDRISIQKAIYDYFDIELLCNMDYYLNNLDQMEKDLKREIGGLDLNDKLVKKKLSEELFYNEMCKIFGDIENDDDKKPDDDDSIYEKSFILEDFHLIYGTTDFYVASAKRGDFYLNFVLIDC